VAFGAGFGYEHPYLLPTGGSLSATAGAWWTNEATFESRSLGGRFSIAHDLGRGERSRGGLVSGWDARATYRHERLTYSVKEEALNDLGSVEERIALGLDPVTGRGDGTVAGVSLDVTRRSLDDATDPARGTTLTVHGSHVAPWLGGTFKFDELRAEVRGYLPIRGRVRIAAKLRGGTLAASDSTMIPFAERYFLGGASSVRGWGRFQISPTSSDGLPVGGRTPLDASAELRFPVWYTFGAVAFLDAGSVWREAWQVDLDDLRYAVGGGIRWTSLIGIVRADFGYQLNPIPDLRVEGKLLTRRWRIHLSIGHAF
jgi:outer membrane translocation and assembly module TamA